MTYEKKIYFNWYYVIFKMLFMVPSIEGLGVTTLKQFFSVLHLSAELHKHST